MVKKAKILEPIDEDFEDVVETLVENKKKYMKQDTSVKKIKKRKAK